VSILFAIVTNGFNASGTMRRKNAINIMRIEMAAITPIKLAQIPGYVEMAVMNSSLLSKFRRPLHAPMSYRFVLTM
jgi:hypothetical protein